MNGQQPAVYNVALPVGHNGASQLPFIIQSPQFYVKDRMNKSTVSLKSLKNLV